MSHVLVIAGRELAEKRFVFLAAIAFALLAALLPLVPGVHSNPRDVIALTSMILTGGFTAGLAGILGASMVGRDVSAGRLSFYFARPVTGSAIWFGKLAAAAVLVVASFAIIILPALIATGGRLARTPIEVVQILPTLAVAAVAFFFVAHALSTMIRSRSMLIGADFAAAIATSFVLWQLARPLLGALSALNALLIGFAAALLVVLVAAGAWQLADGRTDRRRSHAAFSTALWGGVAVALVLAAGYLGWILSATPRDLGRVVRLDVSPRGAWVVVRGVARHRFDFEPVFLMNADSGEARRIAQSWDAYFSADGSKFLDVGQDGTRLEVVIRDSATGRATATDVAVPRYGALMAATDDLARFAVVEHGLLSVYDVASRRALGSARPPVAPALMYFASPDVVRFYAFTSGQVSAWDFDTAHRALRTNGAFETQAIAFRVTADGARVVMQEPHAIVIRDARTLRPIESLPMDASYVDVLGDGRILGFDSHVLRVAGTPGAIDLGAGHVSAWRDLGAGLVSAWRDLGGGKVAVGMMMGRARWIELVDVDRGVVVRRDAGLMLPSKKFSACADPRAMQWSPNLIVLRGASVVRWNALTGETKVLVPG